MGKSKRRDGKSLKGQGTAALEASVESPVSFGDGTGAFGEQLSDEEIFSSFAAATTVTVSEADVATAIEKAYAEQAWMNTPAQDSDKAWAAELGITLRKDAKKGWSLGLTEADLPTGTDTNAVIRTQLSDVLTDFTTSAPLGVTLYVNKVRGVKFAATRIIEAGLKRAKPGVMRQIELARIELRDEPAVLKDMLKSLFAEVSYQLDRGAVVAFIKAKQAASKPPKRTPAQAKRAGMSGADKSSFEAKLEAIRLQHAAKGQK